MITRNGLVSLIILSAGLLAGYLASRGLEGFLALEVREKDFPELNTVYPEPDAGAEPVPLRMSDMGGVGIPADTAGWGDDYSHHTRLFEEVFLEASPFADTLVFRRELEKLSLFSGRMKRYGFNAMVMPWFLELINFDLVGDGKQIYGDASPYRRRHNSLQPLMDEWFRLASDSGLSTYLQTDMVAFTPPLKRYFEERFGSSDPENPEFWEIYRKGAEELFRRYPQVEGLVIRTGEAGPLYNQPGWEYTSELLVRSKKSVQLMLTAFLQAAGQYDRTIVFRTWSVGIGSVGNLHTDPETYREVLGEICSEHLVVSTKYSDGDFYSWLPLNRTLFTGGHRRMVEFQARREYEGSGSMPNFVAPLHQSALQSFLHHRGDLAGAWVWTQSGGPLRAGPMSLYPFYGFNPVTDLNVYTTSGLLTDPYAPVDSLLAVWTAENFGADSLLVSRVTEFFRRSHEVLKHGLYISEFARHEVRALGLEPPPMLWIFEWDILGASSSVFSQIYRVGRDHFESMVDEGYLAVRGAVAMKELLLEVRNRVERNAEQFDRLVWATDYETEVLRLLDYYRRYMMHYYRWIDTGDPGTASTYRLAMGQFRAVMDHHRAKYGDNLNTMGFQFDEAEKGLEVAGKSGASVRWARVTIVLILFLFLLGIPGLVRERAHLRFSGTLLYEAIFRPYRISAMQNHHSTGRLALFILILYLLSLAVFSSFSSLVFPLAFGLAGLLFPYLLALFIRRGRNFRKIWISLMAPKLLIMILLISLCAVRGPMQFWYLFWSSSLFRMIWLALFGMLLFRKGHVYLVAVRRWSRRNRAGSAALCLIVFGLQGLLVSAALLFFGLEISLTALNDELLILPGGLSRILGITTHLGIPRQIPLWGIYASLSLLAVSSVLYYFNRRSYYEISPVGHF